MWIVFLWLAAARAATAAAWESDSLPPPTPDSVAPARAVADTSTGPWFYRGLPYGSESLIHPVRLVLNGGFGILQFDDRSNRLGDVNFRHGWNRLWSDVGSPFRTIRIAGWGDFLRREVVPVSASRRSAQYWPNYTLHLIGGGMSDVMMREWFEQHGAANPTLSARVTLASYHLLNEVVEASAREAPATDAVADLLIFDPAGVWLFGHEGVDRFFSRRLNLRDWSGQPAIDPTTGAIENHGQSFSIKVPIPGSDHWSGFYYFGNHGEAGLSWRRANGSAFSAGAGMSARELVALGNGSETAELVPSCGFFYDRNGSLLFSVTAAKNSRYAWRVNAYPGLIRVRGWTAGLFALGGRDGRTILGVHAIPLPLGLAH